MPCIFKFKGDSSIVAKIRKVLMITDSDTGYNSSRCQKVEFKRKEAPATPWIMLNNIPLNEDDKTIVLSSGWLNDKHINFANQILKKQFPGLTGLVLTLILSQSKPLSPISTALRYVQIIHTNGNHWVVASTRRSPKVRVYDSLSSAVGLNVDTAI